MFRLSWGYKIAILYSGFVIMILSLVFATSQQKIELVTEDYYQQETLYQQKLNASANAQSLKEPLQLTESGGLLKLRFPERFHNQELSGKVRFYSAGFSASDREFPLSQLTGGEWTVARDKLATGRYEAQVSWKAGGTDYYQVIPFTLQ